MVDMEFQDLIINYDSDKEEEEEGDGKDDPAELREPTVCCRCSRSIPVDEQVFDCDSCPHFSCVLCRFRDNVHCILCKPLNKTLSSATTQEETSNLSELFSMYSTKKKINKEHIVDVELSTEEGSVQKQMCKICNRVFKKSNACYHYACASGEKPLVCTECGKKFVKKSHLESHLNSHYGVRPYKCTQPKCKASFMQKDKLIRHMKSHNKETKFTCTVCEKLYTTQDILNHHMIKVHSSSKKFKCDQCPRSYKYPSSLRIHKLKHQAKRDYMCEVCGKKYALSAQLKLHKRCHVLYQRRPYKCRCGGRFMSRRDKARHELIHNSCHDYECSLCNTTFGRKDNLERHMKNFHQEDPRIFTKKGKLAATVTPFTSTHTIPGKGPMNTTILGKKETIKAQRNKVKKHNATKKIKQKTAVKQSSGKEIISNLLNLPKSAKPTKKKSNQNTMKSTSKTPDDATSEIDGDLNKKLTVIVSPQQTVVQNRPSVIKSLPSLLPYRVLPPDKRFLKMNGEISTEIDRSQTQTSSAEKVNHLNTQTNTLQNKQNPHPIHHNPGISTNETFKIPENPKTPQNVRRRISKDDALNRCFRIIHHTDAVQVDHYHDKNISAESRKRSEDNLKTVIRPFDGKVNSFRSRKQPTRFLPSSVFPSPGCMSYNLNQEIRQNSSNIINSVRSLEVANNVSDLSVGGPSLPASFTDSVSEVQEDNFSSSYAPIGETTYSSYTPYFDNEYFRDSMNSYDSNVENLLPNDIDIGFQYINEQLGFSETTLSSESRIIRYVSQEKRIVRESCEKS